MTNFMMNLISWVLLLLVILTLYLIDKVNQLARLQEEALHPPQPVEPPATQAAPPGDILFAGLEGKKLWDAMSGKQVDGFEPSLVEALRPHYEPILHEHIVTTFQDGMEDAKEAEPKPPGSLRTIGTARGEVESWLPPQHLGSIYRTALEFAADYLPKRDPDTYYRLQETLDSVTGMLYQRAGLTLTQPFSELLMNQEKYPLAQPGAASPPEPEPTPAEVLPTTAEVVQGLGQVQAYEEQQRQDLAAEAAIEVLEPVLPAPQQPVLAEPEDKAV